MLLSNGQNRLECLFDSGQSFYLLLIRESKAEAYMKRFSAWL
jgi:hypothetical protein